MSNPTRRTTTSRPRGRGRAQPKRRTSPWIWLGIAVLVIVVAGVALAFSRNQSAQTIISPTASSDQIGVIKTYTGLSRDHKEGTLSYAQNPPVGGAHNSVWQNCGVYSQPVQNENAVHSLEHGAVWITYRPDLPADQVAAIRSDASGQSYVLVSPYPGLPAPVVASAWGTQMLLDSATDPKLAGFIKTYEQGPQTPEPGAACSGGVGNPS